MVESSLFFRVQAKLKSFVAPLFRKRIASEMRNGNALEKCTIISSNCIGAMFLHDLNLRFDSPTVNLFFEAEDFVKFLENIDFYLSLPLVDVALVISLGYPVGKLGDIRLFFVHYKTPEECINKWETRKQRIDRNQIFVINTDRNGMSKGLLTRYLALPYKKIIFVSNPDYVVNDECILVPGFVKNGQVCEMTKYADWYGHRYYEKYFDLTKWINRVD